MIAFSIASSIDVMSAVSSICNTTQSHITLAVVNSNIIIGAIGPEFFKLYNTGSKVEIEDTAIRIPAKVMKTVCTSACNIRFEIDNSVKIFKMQQTGVTLGVTIPLEQDFCLDLIASIIRDGTNSVETLDISALTELRSLVTYTNSGLQCKEGLAYVVGPGFMAYKELESKLSFIMTKDNIGELVKFAASFSSVEAFESGIYTVFFSKGFYFGCKQPRQFIDSEYESFKSAKALYSTQVNLTELRNVLKSIGIPKGSNPKCEFDMEHFVMRMDLNTYGKYAVVIGNQGQQPITSKSAKFAVLTDTLMKILSSSSSKVEDIPLTVYKSFVAFEIKGISFLIVRE